LIPLRRHPIEDFSSIVPLHDKKRFLAESREPPSRGALPQLPRPVPRCP
jgi:hypothetical protein